jgi:hypothetical protein
LKWGWWVTRAQSHAVVALDAAASVTPAEPMLLRPRRGSVDLGLWHELHARRKRGDPQRRRVYAWQREVLAELQEEPLLGEQGRRITQQGARAAALAYLTHLWTTYAPVFKPYYPGVPYLRVGFATGRRPRRRRATFGAYAVPQRHAIYCRLASLRRTTLVHEVGHLFAWGDGHGPDFCATLVWLWEREFGIDPGRALALAHRLDVAVNHAPLLAVALAAAPL